MKSIIVKAFVGFVLLLIAMSTLLYFFSQNIMLDKMDRIRNNDIKVVVFGSSHAGGFKYNNFGFNLARVASDGNTLYYDLQNFRFIKDEIVPATIVLLPVSFFSFGLDENSSNSEDLSLSDYYDYLPTNVIFDYSMKKKVQAIFYRVKCNFYKLFSGVNRSLGARIEASHEDEPIVLDVDTINLLNQRTIAHLQEEIRDNKSLVPMKKALKRHARTRSNLHKAQGTFVQDAASSYKYLDSLIMECRASGLRPFLVTTPFYIDYNSGFDAEWLHNNFYKYVHRLVSKHKVPHLNYANDKRISQHPCLFNNTDHLNYDGGYVFTNYFFSDFNQKYGGLYD